MNESTNIFLRKKIKKQNKKYWEVKENNCISNDDKKFFAIASFDNNLNILITDLKNQNKNENLPHIKKYMNILCDRLINNFN